VPAPGQAGEISLFMLPAALTALPADRGVLIYCGIGGSGGGFTTLGALTKERPSTVIRTGWPTNPELAPLPAVQLGLSVEPLATVANAAGAVASSAEWDKLGFAQLVARDLFNFMQSFSQVSPRRR
jgi:hypothetical protein